MFICGYCGTESKVNDVTCDTCTGSDFWVGPRDFFFRKEKEKIHDAADRLGITPEKLQDMCGNDCLDFEDIMAGLRIAIGEQDGEEVARIYNQICAKKISYDEDSLWQYTGEDDNA